MSRPTNHKKLVDAIIDNELQAKDIAARAAELGANMAERVTALQKGLLAAVIKGRIDKATATRIFKDGYKAFSLAGMAIVAKDVTSMNASLDAINAAAKEVGKDITALAAIRKPDMLARASEKAGLTNGGSETNQKP